jgi:predicted nucleic acid-binding protein
MPEGGRFIVTNTTPLIALAVATDSLDILRALYDRVIVPLEVSEEILAAGPQAPGAEAFRKATWLECRKETIELPLYLRNSLDRGEASVIQTAVSENIEKVCIDESVGRRIARLNGLVLTGTAGILVKARQQGYPLDLPMALERMKAHGIWLGDTVVRFVLAADGG